MSSVQSSALTCDGNGRKMKGRWLGDVDSLLGINHALAAPDLQLTDSLLSHTVSCKLALKLEFNFQTLLSIFQSKVEVYVRY